MARSRLETKLGPHNAALYSREGEVPSVTVRDGIDVPGRIRRGGCWRQLTCSIRFETRSQRGPNFTDASHRVHTA